MAKRVFKVRVIKGFGSKMTEGMEFEVMSSFKKPTSSEMKKAFKEKYGEKLPVFDDKHLHIS